MVRTFFFLKIFILISNGKLKRFEGLPIPRCIPYEIIYFEFGKEQFGIILMRFCHEMIILLQPVQFLTVTPKHFALTT